MATDEVWKAAWAGRLKPWHALPGQQVLCIGCLETRIGRTLTANDFLPVVLNDPGHGYKSDRLLDRLADADWRERLVGQDWQDDDVSEPDEDTLFGGGKGG
jgi:hypothetical protein